MGQGKRLNDEYYEEISEQEATVKKPSKKKMVIISAISLLVVAAVVLTVLLVGLSNKDNVLLEIGDLKYSIADGKATVVGVTSNLTEVTIPSSVKHMGAKYDVVAIGSFAFSQCDSLTSVSIPNTVTSIGNSAFAHCYNLVNMELPNSLTSIGIAAFSDCYFLENIVIPKSVLTMGERAFANCDRLTISCHADSIMNGWSDKWNIASCPIVWDWNIENFYNCIEYWDISATSNDMVTAYLFNSPGEEDTYGLVIAGNGNMKNWSDPNTSWYSVDGSKIKTVIIKQGVTSIGDYAFRSCESLASVEIPNSVTTIGDFAFSWCDSLASIEIPNGVTTIGNYAFQYCDSLKNIVVPNSVETIGLGAFGGCSALESITLPFVGGSANATSASESTLFGYIFGTSGGVGTMQYYASSSYKTYHIPNRLKNVTITGGNLFYGAFYGCSNITSIDITQGVTSIDSYAFYNCSSLANVVIPYGVTYIGNRAFYLCQSLTNIDIPRSVTSIADYAFYECKGLTSIVIPNSVTSLGYYVFGDCDALTIYCEAQKSQPNGWNSNWNPDGCPVEWGYKI